MDKKTIIEAEYKNYTFAVLYSQEPQVYVIFLRPPHDPFNLIIPYRFSIILQNTTEAKALELFERVIKEFFENYKNLEIFVQWCQENDIPLESAIKDEIEATS